MSTGASSKKKKIIDFMKGATPKMPDWRLYGHMYHDEKMKVPVEKAHGAACQEHDQKVEQGIIDKESKRPYYMTYWSALAQEMYANETAEVKAKVAVALKEQSDQAKRGGLSVEDADGCLRQLKSYVIQLFTF